MKFFTFDFTASDLSQRVLEVSQVIYAVKIDLTVTAGEYKVTAWFHRDRSLEMITDTDKAMLLKYFVSAWPTINFSRCDAAMGDDVGRSVSRHYPYGGWVIRRRCNVRK